MDGEFTLATIRICICTPDFVNIVKNGGIGTSFHHAARLLAQNSADVTVLYADFYDRSAVPNIALAKAVGVQEGYRLHILLAEDNHEIIKRYVPADAAIASAHLAYEYLKNADFDIILFPEWRGLPFFCTVAKKMGLHFARTQLWVQVHSPSLWHELNNQRNHYGIEQLRLFQMERKSIELADRVLLPTAYLLDWINAHGFRLPPRTNVLPLLIDDEMLAAQHSASPRRPVRELVFFGRLERRKGLHLFLEALLRLVHHHRDDIDLARLRVTFLGKLSQVDGEISYKIIERMLGGSGLNFVYQPVLGAQAAMDYLHSVDGVAVIPSLADNSPMVVHECIATHYPFIAANTGGIPELIAKDDHDALLFAPNAIALAERMLSVLKTGVGAARPRVDQGINLQHWIDAIRSDTAALNASVIDAPRSTPLVSICITHYERPDYLRTTLEGIARQTYGNIEVIIADNGSSTPGAQDFLDSVARRYPALVITVHHLPDLYAGAARNFGVSMANGEYIVFMDDDNFAHPTQIETFVQALTASGYDALSCIATTFQQDQDPLAEGFAGDALYVPIGSGVSLNLLGNAYGDANGIFRASALRTVGGFTEERLSWEDYELYSRLEHSGFKVGVVPEPLLYLRMTVGSVSRRGAMLPNYYRALRPALDHFPWDTFGDALLVALNNTLDGLSQVRGEASEPDPRGALHAEDPVAVCRLLAREAYRNAGWQQAVDRLKAYVVPDEAAALLSIDIAALSIGSEQWLGRDADRNALEACIFDVQAKRSLAGLVHYFDEIERKRSLLTDELYLRGLARLLSGEGRDALDDMANAAAVTERYLLGRHEDVRKAVAAGEMPSAVHHFLAYGAHEGRSVNYTPPVMHIFARQMNMLPQGVLAGLKRLPYADDRDLAELGALLIFVCMENGAVLAAAEAARRFIGEIGRRNARRQAAIWRELQTRVAHPGLDWARLQLAGNLSTEQSLQASLARARPKRWLWRGWRALARRLNGYLPTAS